MRERRGMDSTFAKRLWSPRRRECAINGAHFAACYTRLALASADSPMPLTLVVPGLLDLSPRALEAIDSDAPALARLLASAEPGIDEHDGPTATACRVCG